MSKKKRSQAKPLYSERERALFKILLVSLLLLVVASVARVYQLEHQDKPWEQPAYQEKVS